MKNRNLEHSDNWATPDYFLAELKKEFNFDFDPCPYNTGELEFDGLLIDWGKVNFINPPYSQKLKEAFVQKAIQESHTGKPYRKAIQEKFVLCFFQFQLLQNYFTKKYSQTQKK